MQGYHIKIGSTGYKIKGPKSKAAKSYSFNDKAKKVIADCPGHVSVSYDEKTEKPVIESLSLLRADKVTLGGLYLEQLIVGKAREVSIEGFKSATDSFVSSIHADRIENLHLKNVPVPEIPVGRVDSIKVNIGQDFKQNSDTLFVTDGNVLLRNKTGSFCYINSFNKHPSIPSIKLPFNGSINDLTHENAQINFAHYMPKHG